MKQSFRAILPAIEEPIPFDDLVVRAKRFATVVVGEAGAAPPAAGTRPRPILMVVGPEAGLSAGEQKRLMAASAERVSISDHRLRSETAAVVMTGLFAERRNRD
jgi:RsmE family RNA methyltransferase